MKKHGFLLLISIIFFLPGFTQINALFVNDNSLNQEDSELMHGILEQYLGTLAYFDAVENERSPGFDEMSAYNLVIWYCSTDEENLYFWNGNFQDNEHLKEYLDFGGSLWLIGRDFLNARYIKPPRTYAAGSILFDYLGIDKWSAESQTDDNGQGVPVLLVENGSPVDPSLDSLNWSSQTEPLVDGCQLVEGCYKTYKFGPTGYSLYGQAAAFYYPAKKFKNLTFTFDPVRMKSKGSIQVLLSDILIFYEEVLSGVESSYDPTPTIRIFPNPANSKINVELLSPHIERILIIDLLGNILKEISIEPNASYQRISTIDVADLSEGIYFASFQNQDGMYSRKFVVTR